MSGHGPVRLDPDLMEQATREAKRQHRSTRKQIEFWVELGRAVDGVVTREQAAGLRSPAGGHSARRGTGGRRRGLCRARGSTADPDGPGDARVGTLSGESGARGSPGADRPGRSGDGWSVRAGRVSASRGPVRPQLAAAGVGRRTAWHLTAFDNVATTPVLA